MKFKIVILLLAVVFLASCSNSRYGNVPKGNKNTSKIKRHTSRYSKTAKAKNIETIVAKTVVEANELPKLHTPKVEQPKALAKSKKPVNVFKAEDKQRTLENSAIINKTLKPQKTEKQSKENDIAKGSWLWYVVVGLVLMLIGAIIPVVGWVFYVIGVIAVVFGLLILLGLF